MKDRPILFSGPLVRAILDGRKTVTRRLVKPQPPAGTDALRDVPFENRWWAATAERDEDFITYTLIDGQKQEWKCRYGMRGDRLWVRETINLHFRFAMPTSQTPQLLPTGERVWSHAADGIHLDTVTRGVPSIHMPRWMSRITLEITDVRVERLQEISEADARAEGVEPEEHYTANPLGPYYKFMYLWDEIHGERASWASNPFVWRIEFTRVEE